MTAPPTERSAEATPPEERDSIPVEERVGRAIWRFATRVFRAVIAFLPTRRLVLVVALVAPV
ncbi:MAG TPA: hypothetical protein VIP79_02825, partial [Gemmatimonadaceae bacterium]